MRVFFGGYCTCRECTDPFRVLGECTQFHKPQHVLGECAQIHSMLLESGHRYIPCTWERCKDACHELAEHAKIWSVFLESAQIQSIDLENVHRSIPFSRRVWTDLFHLEIQCTWRMCEVLQSIPCAWRVCTDPFHVLGECAQIHSMYLESAHRPLPCP